MTVAGTRQGWAGRSCDERWNQGFYDYLSVGNTAYDLDHDFAYAVCGFANDITVALKQWIKSVGIPYRLWWDVVCPDGVLENREGMVDAYFSRGFANPSLTLAI